MRIAVEQRDFIFNYWKEKASSNEVYLFGSRVDDSKKGGDIDILILSENKIKHTDFFKMKQLFYGKFGAQKLDIVGFTKEDQSAFKKYILSYAKLLKNE
jgi:predicted nucleotidyltransferase